MSMWWTTRFSNDEVFRKWKQIRLLYLQSERDSLNCWVHNEKRRFGNI